MSVVRKIIFAIALIVFLIAAWQLGKYFWQMHTAESAFDSLKTSDEHDLVALHKKNPDIVGWIEVPGTKIDYPVMQTTDDPEYYLRRNFEKEHSTAGTPFMDAASTIGVSKNYIIYGHNIKAGTMFHDLLDFDEKEFWEEHKVFYYDELKDGKQVHGEYEIIAAFESEIKEESDKSFKYYAYAAIEDAATYNEYVEGVKNETAYDNRDATATYPEQLVTLSTCSYHTDDGRFAVVGRKVK